MQRTHLHGGSEQKQCAILLGAVKRQREFQDSNHVLAQVIREFSAQRPEHTRVSLIFCSYRDPLRHVYL